MQDVLISVVTVCYNAAEYIEETLLSVFNQNIKNLEYVLVDGGSKDNTVEIIERVILKFPQIKVVFKSEPDNGIYDAMNKAIDMASGQWIFFLNVGDIFATNTILSDIFIDKDLSGVSAIYTDVLNKTEQCVKYIPADKPFFAHNHHFLNMGFGHQSVIVLTSYAKLYKFNLSYKCCADYDMIRKIFNANPNFYYIPKALCITENRFGFSEDHKLLQLRELAKICNVENTLKFKRIYMSTCIKSIVISFCKKVKGLFN